MIQPSCLLTPEWKIPMSGKSYFYIRFTCNGFTPTLGKETIMVKYGPQELISSPSCISSVSNPDLVGPFEKISIKGPLPDDVPEAYAYIYYLREATSIFHSHYNILPENCNIIPIPIICDEEFEYYFDIPTPQNTWSDLGIRYPGAIQVLWKKAIINLYSCPKSTVIINGQSFLVYSLNFNDLFLLTESRRIFLPGGGSNLYSFSSRPYIEAYLTFQDWFTFLWGDGPSCPPENDSGTAGYISVDWTDIQGVQPIIISDAFGNNPQFPGVSLNLALRLVRMCYNEEWEASIFDIVSALGASSTYSMVLSQNF